MSILLPTSHDSDRLAGDSGVLRRLERLGHRPRTLGNLSSAGFPALQLDQARQWYTQKASTHIELYAARTMARGYFEDEALLDLFCRYFDCTDWCLEGSPWFFAPHDYDRFTRALVEPVTYHATRLEQGLDPLNLVVQAVVLPAEIMVEAAREKLWEDLLRRDYFWKPQSSYTHLRAANMFGYLSRTLDLPHFKADQYNYRWEEAFREAFGNALAFFDRAVIRAALLWQEAQKEAWQRPKGTRGKSNRAPPAPHPATPHLSWAFTLLGLEPATATLTSLGKAFRQRSLSAHPDQGGSGEAFRQLSEARNLIEGWLRIRSN